MASFVIQVRTATMPHTYICPLGVENKSTIYIFFAHILIDIFAFICVVAYFFIIAFVPTKLTGNAKVTCVDPINLAAEELYNCAGEGDRAVQCA